MKRRIATGLGLGLVLCMVLAGIVWASSMTIVSDTSVMVYGPLTSYAPLDGAWGTGEAAVPSFVHSAWGPGTSGHIDGATWISTAFCPEDTENDSWRKFTKTFELCAGAYNASGTLWVNSDNAEEAYFGETLLGSDGEVTGTADDNYEWSTVEQYSFTPLAGVNTLAFIVRNYAMSGGNCSSNPTALTFKAEITYDCPIQVTIDIKPGSDPNCFNNDDHGVIPVAILGSADFDVTQIDPSSVQLDSLAVKAVGKSDKLLAHIENVNGDGFSDLVVQIQDQDGAFASGSGMATLTGNLYAEFGGTPVIGSDSICIVPPPPILVVSSLLNFSGTGWGGWSCPPDHPNVVDGGVSKTNTQPFVPADYPVNQVAAVLGATLDGYTFPVFPHYTYGSWYAGETGWAVHNGGTAQSLYVYVYCVE